MKKLLEVFNLSVEGMTTIDIGASTGGFTDVMLQNGLNWFMLLMSDQSVGLEIASR